MLVFRAHQQSQIAEKHKAIAIQAHSNYNEFLPAANFFKEAAKVLAKELKDKNITPYKRWYGRYLEFVYEYETLNSFYQYYKLSQDFAKAENYLTEISAAVDEIDFYEMDVLPRKVINSQDYNELEYNLHVIDIRYRIFFFELVKEEFYAKKYSAEKNYLKALNFYNICQQHIKKLLNFIQINKEIISQNRIDNAYLNAAIVALNYAQSLIGASQEHELKNDKYYCLSVINNLIKTLDLCKTAYALSGDSRFLKGENTTLKNIQYVINDNKQFWQIIYDSHKSDERIVGIMQSADANLLSQVSNTSLGQQVVKNALLFFVHGFNTRGEWKNTATEVFSDASGTSNYKLVPFDYGEFKIGFAIPSSRKRVINDFRELYNQKVSKYSGIDYVYCIAHSFGTFIIAENIKKFPEVFFDKLIFAGSIIRSDYDWLYAKAKRPSLEVLFEVQEKDNALWAANLYSKIPWVKWIGDAGRKGFNGQYNFVLEKTHPYSAHSDVFSEVYIRNAWLAFLDA